MKNARQSCMLSLQLQFVCVRLKGLLVAHSIMIQLDIEPLTLIFCSCLSVTISGLNSPNLTSCLFVCLSVSAPMTLPWWVPASWAWPQPESSSCATRPSASSYWRKKKSFVGGALTHLVIVKYGNMFFRAEHFLCVKCVTRVLAKLQIVVLARCLVSCFDLKILGGQWGNCNPVIVWMGAVTGQTWSSTI